MVKGTHSFFLVAWNGRPMTPVSVWALMPASSGSDDRVRCGRRCSSRRHIVRVSGEQHGRIEFTGVQVVGGAAGDVRGTRALAQGFQHGAPRPGEASTIRAAWAGVDATMPDSNADVLADRDPLLRRPQLATNRRTGAEMVCPPGKPNAG
jgi:hypothetical protein